MRENVHVVCVYGQPGPLWGLDRFCYDILERFVGPTVGDDTPWTRDFANGIEWRPEVRAIYMDDWNGIGDLANRVARIRRERPAPSEPFLVLINSRREVPVDLPPGTTIVHCEGENTRLPDWLR